MWSTDRASGADAPTPTVPVPALPVPRTATPAPPTATAVPATATPAATATHTATATSQPTATSTTAPVEETPPPVHHVVVIVIDAGRPLYFNDAKLPHIAALMQHGVTYDRAFVGEMESSTPGVHVTLGTGTLPREDGYLGFGWLNGTQWVDFRSLIQDGQIDARLRSLPTPSVDARLHQFYPGAVSIASSGHKDYAVVGLGGGAATYEIYGRFQAKQFLPTSMPGYTPPPLSAAERASLTVKSPLPVGAEDAWAFKYASLVASHTAPRLLEINVPETDTWGHWDGPNDNKVFGKLMLGIDQGIGELEATYQKLGILANTDFIITADHGMMESHGVKNWKTVQQTINSTGARVMRADGSGGAIWLADPTKAKAAALKLAATAPQHVEAIFYRSGPGLDYRYIRASPLSWLVNPQVSTALSYLVNTTAGLHGPDIWVLYHENYTVDSNNVSGKWKGTHGGATWKVQHIPLIISGPGIRQGVHSSFPAQEIDIAPTVERLIGLPAIKRDGVILADAFSQPLPGETSPERAIEPYLTSIVNALQQQSQRDDRFQHWPKLGPIYHCQNAHDPHCEVSAQTSTNG